MTKMKFVFVILVFVCCFPVRGLNADTTNSQGSTAEDGTLEDRNAEDRNAEDRNAEDSNVEVTSAANSNVKDKFDERRAFRLSFWSTMVSSALFGGAYVLSAVYWQELGIAAPFTSYGLFAVSLGFSPSIGYLYLKERKHGLGVSVLRTAILAVPIGFGLGLVKTGGSNCSGGTIDCKTGDEAGVAGLVSSSIFAVLAGSALAIWDIASVKKKARALNSEHKVNTSFSVQFQARATAGNEFLGYLHGTF